MSVIDETVSFSLEVNVDKAQEELRKVQTLLYRSLELVRRLSGNENLNEAIRLFQRAIAVSNQLRLSLIALEAASGPVGWALALVGVAGTALTMTDMLYDVMRVG